MRCILLTIFIADSKQQKGLDHESHSKPTIKNKKKVMFHLFYLYIYTI